MSPALPVLNLSAYKFVTLTDLPALRERLLGEALRLGLKGTVLLAEEGLNLFVAGAQAPVREWLAGLKADPRVADLQPKESFSASVPFKRMLVKIKHEIIRMNRPAVQPGQGRAPAVAPLTLARWLAQGHDDDSRPVVTLDTRNGFEVDCGAFEGALDWRLDKFSDFPSALQAHRAQLEGKTVVSYCTGGIRCEKAALVLQAEGVRAFQLEGGILKYFEETADAPHWRGSCFVFDERIALDPRLAPAS